jgi:hypothetical protein
LNPNISVETVTKRFFNKYCFKLDLEIHGSAFLRYPTVPISEQIANRSRVNRKINFGGSWRNFLTQTPGANDVKALEYFLANQLMSPGKLKFRIEEPILSVYAEDETDLFNLATDLCDHLQNNKQIKRIHRPKTSKHLDLLQQGFTVKQNKFGYSYKIILREGRYSYAVKQQLHNYLKNLGDEVLLPEHLKEALDKTYDSFWGSYFYTKDLGVVTMISLISPTFIRSVETYQAVTK